MVNLPVQTIAIHRRQASQALDKFQRQAQGVATADTNPRRPNEPILHF
jgi:hypothetical protein